MESEKLMHYLKTLSKALNIPITYGRITGEIKFFEPFDITTEENGPDYILNKLRPVIDKFYEENVIYCVTSDLILMGIVVNRNTGEFVFVGPLASYTTTEKEIENYLNKVNLSVETTQKLAKYMYGVKTLTQNSLIELLSNINLILNDEIRKHYDIVAAYDADTTNRIAFAYREFDISSSKQDIKDVENAYNYNLKLSYYILNGNTDGLAEFLEKTEDYLITQSCGQNNISELKIIAFSRIFSAEMIALKSGIPSSFLEETQRFYLRKINTVSSEGDLKPLIVNATIDFTKQVKDYISAKTDNPAIDRATAYIRNNIMVKLTIDDIARATNINKRYLFSRFKNETGKTLTQFINEEKIKKACYYLQFTQKTLAEIAVALSFSTQSYFQAVFKKVMGKTPMEWRKSNIFAN